MKLSISEIFWYLCFKHDNLSFGFLSDFLLILRLVWVVGALKKILHVKVNGLWILKKTVTVRGRWIPKIGWAARQAWLLEGMRKAICNLAWKDRRPAARFFCGDERREEGESGRTFLCRTGWLRAESHLGLSRNSCMPVSWCIWIGMTFPGTRW